jgi:hypothetical protein
MEQHIEKWLEMDIDLSNEIIETEIQIMETEIKELTILLIRNQYRVIYEKEYGEEIKRLGNKIEQIKLQLEQKEEIYRTKNSMSYNLEKIRNVLIEKKRIILNCGQHSSQITSKIFVDARNIVSYLEPIYNALKIINK